MSDRLETSAELPMDRRSVLFGLGLSAAAASFAPFVTASAAYAAPPALAPALGAPVPAVFWNLAYTDFTGVVAGHKPVKAKVAVPMMDLDPHAEMLAAR